MSSGVSAGQYDPTASTRAPEPRNGKEVVGSFDWIGDFEDFKDLLAPAALGVSGSPRMLMVGCGTSTLSEKLYHTGYRDMVNVDIDQDQIAHMREQHLDKPTMEWRTADITDMTLNFPVGECFEVIVDKGTLDALLCTDQAAEMLCEEWRLLAIGGVLVTISFRPADFISALLAAPSLPAAISSAAVNTGGRDAGTVFYLRKQAASSPDLGTFKAAVDAQIQQWHQEEAPLLTPRREADIREKFALLSANANGRVAIGACHVVLFGEEERGEYGYDEDLFRDDLRAWRAQQREDGAAAGEETEGLTVDEALAFLKEMQ